MGLPNQDVRISEGLKDEKNSDSGKKNVTKSDFRHIDQAEGLCYRFL